MIKQCFVFLLSIMMIGCSSTDSTMLLDGLDKNEYSSRLSSNLYYPEEARKANLEGTATIKAQINRSGHVIGITVVKSSGHTMLDTAAMRTFLATKFPRHTSAEPISVVIPLVYSLDSQ